MIINIAHKNDKNNFVFSQLLLFFFVHPIMVYLSEKSALKSQNLALQSGKFADFKMAHGTHILMKCRTSLDFNNVSKAILNLMKLIIINLYTNLFKF